MFTKANKQKRGDFTDWNCAPLNFVTPAGIITEHTNSSFHVIHRLQEWLPIIQSLDVLKAQQQNYLSFKGVSPLSNDKNFPKAQLGNETKM